MKTVSSPFLAIALSIAATLPSAATPQSPAGTPGRPNILYFYVDDMGWGSIAPNAQAERKAKNLPSILTPYLDQLAADGINFARGYGCHVCSPARSSQQSGFHQGHTFADRNDPDNAKKAMRADEILMGDALADAGYVTGYWGKWGYGGSKDMENPTLDNIQTLPTSHGYQHVLAELHHVRAHTFFQPTLWNAPAPKKSRGGLHLIPNSMAPYQNNDAYPNTPALQNHADYPKTAYCDDVYAFHALDFVRTNGQNYNKTGQPFFGLLAVQIPHAPFDEIQELPDWDKAYADDPHFDSLSDQTREWAAMVTRIDAHFGNILAALDDPNNDGDTSDSVADNTLVLFQSDNGGPGGKNNTEYDANGGLTGTKGKIQEGGIRVPLLMRWPAMIHDSSPLKAGTTTSMVVDVTDLLPTFCELADTTIPLGLDGVSIAPTLTGTGTQRPRDFIIHEAGNGQSIIRDNIKLVRSTDKKGENESYALYDLDKDHAEENNIADQHPELVKKLTTLLLDERVAEEKGFCNTYHHWTGRNNAKTSDAENWSDYEYANAGITYITDTGAPQLSWTALIENPGKKMKTARADKDLEFLGLEIRGPQELTLDKGVTLTARNELRLSPGATLTLDGNTVSTMRWIDVAEDATLRGTGTIEGEIYNEGTVDVTLTDKDRLSLLVAGTAHLGGSLAVTLSDDFKPIIGKTFTALAAPSIQGRFNNPDNEIAGADGTLFRIGYADNAVTLTVQSLPKYDFAATSPDGK
ncbi:MAG: sulfatase-like hydrolase/transferase [Verrucomicrobiota bacterium]